MGHRPRRPAVRPANVPVAAGRRIASRRAVERSRRFAPPRVAPVDRLEPVTADGVATTRDEVRQQHGPTNLDVPRTVRGGRKSACRERQDRRRHDISRIDAVESDARPLAVIRTDRLIGRDATPGGHRGAGRAAVAGEFSAIAAARVETEARRLSHTGEMRSSCLDPLGASGVASTRALSRLAGAHAAVQYERPAALDRALVRRAGRRLYGPAQRSRIALWPCWTACGSSPKKTSAALRAPPKVWTKNFTVCP
jgi:hypothetical protein